MKDVKIIIGANYGDESKGLVTRQFVKNTKNPIVIFHNGSAQRGHTVDYNPAYRHVYHHFGCGTADGAPTYFADTFWIHPMEFHREWLQLEKEGIKVPNCFYHPNALIITPFDMLVDHATEAYIGWQHGEREHGSCGYGTWCATDRWPFYNFSTKIWLEAVFSGYNKGHYNELMKLSFNECLRQLYLRGVDLDRIPEYKHYFNIDDPSYTMTLQNFLNDLKFFFLHCLEKDFTSIYHDYNLIFENAQGLGLDQNCGKEWHTTSNTGLINPYNMLKSYKDFNAEVCYVTRSYLTRHGIGDLEEEAPKKEINSTMHDATNIPNEFQGSLRYGYLEDKEQVARIKKDFAPVVNDSRFRKTMAVTHCNEFPDLQLKAEYISNNPYSLLKR